MRAVDFCSETGEPGHSHAGTGLPKLEERDVAELEREAKFLKQGKKSHRERPPAGPAETSGSAVGGFPREMGDPRILAVLAIFI